MSLSRRALLGAALGAGTLALTGCARQAEANTVLDLTAPLPTAVPPGTELKISGTQNKLGFELSGLDRKLPFRVPEWPNIAAGPDVINAFRARSLDLAGNAGIPPIQAYGFQLPAKIVAVRLNPKPIYRFATAPGTAIQSVNDFRGKKIAFSVGQAQGVVVLRALKAAGIANNEVTLVPLNSPQFLTALQSRQVDVAPLGSTDVFKYLRQYEKDGARRIDTDVVDLLSILWAPEAVLRDAGKVAAIRAYIPLWAQVGVWQWEHPDAWIDEYYVKSQGISRQQGEEIVRDANKPNYPADWTAAIAWEQETIDLLVQQGFTKPFAAGSLFDRRFEGLAAPAVAAEYRGSPR
ncbi:ABC transporter substrate-binding protein [Luedemannella helvata]|uniref:ABC transporter substrate-binding protein n=1 Tax=Luedemannella helvata TaxID=349315 RepID=A0ABP4WSX6_9ACTN